ncbi:FGGY-family carbohydrate kinase [Pelagovum pacificum]|uniref:Carbohydrate kinase n=1 Tax=Pelagovum pacificum TaxID=2588711 RepID=A0A5C5GE99_9RHOB|nr:FGGY-family carbohydrate kinase [Pelagovum pacificum]QQA43837.1 FGGY-family carbohydrate kinase [Pelagovum pacificum]TNY33033.1 carbohydrate kinase [Pelagovum pacificum]
MTAPRHIAVIDVGKTNAKLALVDLQTLTEIDVVTRPNEVRRGPPWPHFDTEAHWNFFLSALSRFHREHGIDAISVTTHGASAVLLDANGRLAAPILDYEHTGPDDMADAYDAIRPPFAQTGSPRLGMGLNLGAQLHWQFATDPGLLERTAHVLTYPQYWAFRLTGDVSSDVSSMGCHTDLWNPRERTFSDLAGALGIAGKVAPVRKSADVLGPVLPEIAEATGLAPKTPVVCGIHDSNASLYPHLLSQRPPFSVVSTGTWVIAMAIGGADVTLDPARDTLINVSARGDAVPSARFMGGREYEIVRAGKDLSATEEDVAEVLASGLMLLPAVEPTSGPFPGRAMRWQGVEPPEGSGQRAAALSFYLALMTDTCLDLAGARGSTIVEGPFARNARYLAMLAAATGRDVQQSRSATGTSLGAALLFAPDGGTALPEPERVPTPANAEALTAYAARWKAALDG